MKAYIVCGAESSGTRAHARLLAVAGARQALSSGKPGEIPNDPESERPAVVHRSYPHGGEWPDLGALADRLRSDGATEVIVVVVVRDPVACERSQVDHKHVGDVETARENIRGAHLRIFAQLGDLPFVVSTYEAFCARQAYREELVRRLGLEGPASLDVFDANEQRYE